MADLLRCGQENMHPFCSVRLIQVFNIKLESSLRCPRALNGGAHSIKILFTVNVEEKSTVF